MATFNKYLTEEEEKTLFSGIKAYQCTLAQRDYYWMLVIRETACRFSILFGADLRKQIREGAPAHGLTVGDAEQSIKQEQLVYDASTNKRNKDVLIKLTKSAINALKKLIEIHKQMSTPMKWDIALDERPLILSRQGVMSRRSAQNRMKKWSQELLKITATPHWLRHTWAKRYLDNTTSPATALQRVCAVLGHSNIATTGVYTKPSKEDVEQAINEASSCRK